MIKRPLLQFYPANKLVNVQQGMEFMVFTGLVFDRRETVTDVVDFSNMGRTSVNFCFFLHEFCSQETSIPL